jgi:hypothetical protein
MKPFVAALAIVVLGGCFYGGPYRYISERSEPTATMTHRAERSPSADISLHRLYSSLETTFFVFPNRCPESINRPWSMGKSLGNIKHDGRGQELKVTIPADELVVVYSRSSIPRLTNSVSCEHSVGFVPSTGEHYQFVFHLSPGECTVEITDESGAIVPLADDSTCKEQRAARSNTLGSPDGAGPP